MSSKSILIVDDEESITKMLKNVLMLEGYEVETKNCPIEAWELFQQQPFPIVISDIAMPSMNGVDLLRKLKDYESFTQVIMITGYVTLDNVLTAFRMGAQNIFFKPFKNIDDIVDEVALCAKKIDRIKEVLRTMTVGKSLSSD